MPIKHLSASISNWPDWLIESLYAVASGGLFVYLLRGTLFTGHTSFGHDNYYWNYPLFHFFAESLMNGHLPLWNPYTHGGEPFFPILGQMRLLEPVAVFTVLIGKYFTLDIGLLFNWHRVFHSIITFFGVYLCLRRYSPFLIIRLSLITILFFSSVMLGSFRCDGIIHDFLWCPFLFYFLNRIFLEQDDRWSQWLALAGFIGINFQSYFFVPSFLFLLFFFSGMLLFHRTELIKAFQQRFALRKICVALAIIGMMAMPNLAVWQEREHLAFPARTLPTNYESLPPSGASHSFEGTLLEPSAGIRMPYAAIEYTGTFLNLWNYLELLAPDGNRWIHSERFPWKRWGRASEAFLYLGATPFLIILVGFFLSLHSKKKLWLTLFLGFGLYSLGPPGGLHRLLYVIYPPTWFLRHTAYLSLFVEFTLLYFFVIGFNYILDSGKPFQITIRSRQTFFILLLVFPLSLGLLALLEIKHPHEKYLWAGLCGVGIGFYVFRKWLQREGMLLCLLLSFLGILLYLHPYRIKLTVNLTMALALPVLSFLIYLNYQKRKTKLPFLLAVFFLLALQWDLLYRMKEVGVLFNSTLSPSTILEVERTPTRPSFNLEMKITAPTPKVFNEDFQAMRYTEVLFRQPYAFSVPRDPVQNGDPFERALYSRRWDYYLLTKNYQNLVNQPFAPIVLQKLLGIGRPLFELKQNLVLRPLSDWESKFKKQLNPTDVDQSVPFLEINAIGLGSGSESLVTQNNPIDPRIRRWDLHYSKYTYNDVDLTVDSSHGGFLLWRDGYDRHWTAKIDQKSVPLHLANFNHKGIFLPPGLHRVQFSYGPQFFLYSLFSFYLGLSLSALATLCMAAEWLPLRRQPPIQKNLTYGLAHPI